MSGSNVFQQRHARRTDALGKALDIVKDNEFLLTPEAALTLRKHILARFVEGEMHDSVQQFFNGETQNSTLFGHAHGRRR
jgi:hypothetical protein